MAGELINQSIQAELKLKFGIIFPEFVPKSKNPRMYTLAEYSPQEGYVRLEEAVNVYGERVKKLEGFVEYVSIEDEEKIIARREGHFERWGGSNDLRYADIEFIQNDTSTTYMTPPYQFEYEDEQRYGQQITGGTISVHIKDIADRSNEFDLVRAFYADKGRLYTLNVTYGDREELKDYHKKKRQEDEERRQMMYAAGIFGGHDLSFPGVEFMMSEDGSSDISLTDRMSGFQQRGFSGTLRMGQRLTPREIAPYAYEADRQGGQFIAKRIDTVGGSIWTTTTPEVIDFMNLYTESTAPGRNWTSMRQDFPVGLKFQ